MRARILFERCIFPFHESIESLENEYQNMHDTYSRIFNRIGLTFKVVEADLVQLVEASHMNFMY